MSLPDPTRSRAVLVGTANYIEGSEYASNPSVKRSLDAFAENLRSLTGLSDAHICVVDDPVDSLEVGRILKTAGSEATGGMLLFYFVGHGVSLRDNSLALTVKNSIMREKEASPNIRYDFIKNLMIDSAAASKVVILDCCYSGIAHGRITLGEPLVNPESVIIPEIEGSYVLTATDTKSPLALAEGREGYTSFTGDLIDIMRKGSSADHEYLTMDVIFNELRIRARKERSLDDTYPVPRASGGGLGNRVSLARNPKYSKSTTLSWPNGLQTRFENAANIICDSQNSAPRRIIAAKQIVAVADECSGFADFGANRRDPRVQLCIDALVISLRSPYPVDFVAQPYKSSAVYDVQVIHPECLYRQEVVKIIAERRLLPEGSAGSWSIYQPSLRKAILYNCDLSDLDLQRINLRDAKLFGADLSGANLSGSELRDAKLGWAYLSSAILIKASLIAADLSNSWLSEANLSNANLECANITGIKVDGAVKAGMTFKAWGEEEIFVGSFGPYIHDWQE
ncbi:pentapeptide repeat-containing protein [Streptomyces sp. NBC_00654]|uniref:caspase, EACC1-associated type n=1 Tax=Streptomyces sp. NBC_00654 TaxID=2975799 RepID=UPI00225B5E4E|nr:pentapeptide repeat-containing protein [Streptomyces sp. NBC_00654]MCX4964121.1 pentapeptide repeat-containing protein [Streptomyces sp. NBC_00654]